MIHLRRFYFSLRCVFGLRLCRVPCGKPPAFRQARDSFGGSAARGEASPSKEVNRKPEAFRTGGGKVKFNHRQGFTLLCSSLRSFSNNSFADSFARSSSTARS